MRAVVSTEQRSDVGRYVRLLSPMKLFSRSGSRVPVGLLVVRAFVLSHGSREARRSKTFSEDLCRHKGCIKEASAQETQVQAKQKQIKRRHSSLVWTRLVQSSLRALATKGGALEIRPTISCAN